MENYVSKKKNQKKTTKNKNECLALQYIWADKTASRTSRGAALALAKALRDKERPDSIVINTGKLV
jgi:hypothetical protein